MVDVRGASDPGRILYLFDPAGEVYRKQGNLQSQQYLPKAEYLIILIDPFALSEVRSRLSPRNWTGRGLRTLRRPWRTGGIRRSSSMI